MLFILEFFEKWTLLCQQQPLLWSKSTCSHKSFIITVLIQKCGTEEEGLEYLTLCMAAGRQRVDTQLGGDRESMSEGLKALSSDVHWKLEHLHASRMNTAYR